MPRWGETGGDANYFLFTGVTVTQPGKMPRLWSNRTQDRVEIINVSESSLLRTGLFLTLNSCQIHASWFLRWGDKMIGLSFHFVWFSTWFILFPYVCGVRGWEEEARGDVSPLAPGTPEEKNKCSNTVYPCKKNKRLQVVSTLASDNSSSCKLLLF